MNHSEIVTEIRYNERAITAYKKYNRYDKASECQALINDLRIQLHNLPKAKITAKDYDNLLVYVGEIK